MSKKSFDDIEQIIKNAAEAHEPAFDEEAWKKMEAMLDKEKDRKRPFVFWLWWLLPLMIGSLTVSYFTFYDNDAKVEIAGQPDNNPLDENIDNETVDAGKKIPEPGDKDRLKNNENLKKDKEPGAIASVSAEVQKPSGKTAGKDQQNKNEEQFSKKNLSDKVKADMKGKITAAKPHYEETDIENREAPGKPDIGINEQAEQAIQEDVFVVKIDSDKTDEKEIGKIIDSVIEKKRNDKKPKTKDYRFYFIVAGGAEANGVKLFSADKITGRVGMAAGYQVNKNLSVQAGFFVSNKKYIAAGSDYKTKAGSYWSTVDIKSITANCRVYEIPVTIRYDFMPGKKINIFASAGLSSYVMKKEDYHFYYDRYGTTHNAETYYKGNKNLFCVLRLSAGAEKKLSNRVSIFASPGVAVPLSGVGEGEVKLYSTDIIIGLKFSVSGKK